MPKLIILKKTAFTLAETLIVIGIIGVVAALTLPNLNHATGDKEKVTKVKKIYSALTDAFDRAQVVYGNADEWFKDIEDDYDAINERFAKRVSEFLKVSKDCGFGDGCFSSAPSLCINGNLCDENLLDFMQNDTNSHYMVTLSDGTSVSFYRPDTTPYKLGILADIDGPNKGKNKFGDDLFYFSIGIDNSNSVCKYLQLIPDRVIENVGGYPSFESVEYATAWIIENGNLDYLKCPEDLNWETQTSCK